MLFRSAARLFGATLPMTWPQKLICTPQAYEETCSQREKPQQDGEPKNDGILAPAYLDTASIGKFTESDGDGSALRGKASESTNQKRSKGN